MADKSVEPNSMSGSDEEEEGEDEEEVEQSIDGQSGAGFESTSSASIFSRTTEISRQLAEMMEMNRKQRLMAQKKSARAALSFDSHPPTTPRKLKSPFTPTRSAAADEDFERDSLASQSSASCPVRKLHKPA
jgi:hypothetical protein